MYYNEMKYSLLIPTRDGDKYVKALVWTILLENYSNFEVIVSFNNSNNRIPDWARQINDFRFRSAVSNDHAASRSIRNLLHHFVELFFEYGIHRRYLHGEKVDSCFFHVDVFKLKKFIEKDKQAVIIFYGGEPLLQIEKIKEIVDNINVPFRMQTNGKLLDKIPEFIENW
jgi:hypothetical protein